MADMIERAMLAGDREDSAQKGEPSPHDPNYFPPDEEGADVFRLERRAVYQQALLAALDPHDSALQNVILGAMGFYSEGGDFGPMARVQAHDAIAALRQTAQGERTNG